MCWQALSQNWRTLPEGDAGGDDGVEYGDGHDHDVEGGMVDDGVAELGSVALLLKLVHRHQVPFSLPICFQNLLSATTT